MKIDDLKIGDKVWIKADPDEEGWVREEVVIIGFEDPKPDGEVIIMVEGTPNPNDPTDDALYEITADQIEGVEN